MKSRLSADRRAKGEKPLHVQVSCSDHIGIGACVLDVAARVEVCVGCVCVRARSSSGGGHGKFSAVIFCFCFCLFFLAFFPVWLVFMSGQGTAGLTFPR